MRVFINLRFKKSFLVGNSKKNTSKLGNVGKKSFKNESTINQKLKISSQEEDTTVKFISSPIKTIHSCSCLSESVENDFISCRNKKKLQENWKTKNTRER